MKKAIGSLDLNRPQRRGETVGGARLYDNASIREKLLTELVELEKQMEELERGDRAIDLSMIQTYREMIHSRKALFNQLNR